MGVNPIALAVPFFFVFIVVELWVARRRGARVYRFADAVTDLSCGVTQQVTLLFGSVALLGAYAWLYDHHRLVTLPTWAAWLIAFVGVDFIYYWWHRWSHEVNFLWAAHVVHHSSEDYNLAVALRQSAFTAYTGFPLFALLSFAGVPPLVYATMHALNTLYQFWIHTQLVGPLGRLEGVINTPSAHRVHHAINPRYLDRNYGGTLMIWDLWFGTYEAETEPCVYGIVKPLGSFDPLWAQVHYYVELARLSWRAPALVDKLRVWWKGPTWSVPGLPPKAPPPEVSPSTFLKWAPPRGTGLSRYVLVDYAIIVAATFALMLFSPRLPSGALAGAVAAVVVSLVAVGALVEGRRWAWPFEAARLLGVAVGLLLVLKSPF